MRPEEFKFSKKTEFDAPYCTAHCQHGFCMQKPVKLQCSYFSRFHSQAFYEEVGPVKHVYFVKKPKELQCEENPTSGSLLLRYFGADSFLNVLHQI